MKTHKLILLLIMAITFYSCSNDSENDLIETSDDDGLSNDDDQMNTDFIYNYEDDVRPIIQNSCVGCHSSPPVNGAPFALVNYNQVRQRANAILNTMEKQSGTPNAMPPSGRLPQSTIDIIEQWILDGTPEN